MVVSILAPLFVEGVALDGGGAVRPGEVDGTGEEMVGDTLLAVAGPDAEAPHRPHVDLVNVGDLAVSGEARIGAGVHGRPTDDFVVVVGEHARWRILLDEELHPLAACRAHELAVLLGGGEAIAQAPTHAGVGVSWAPAWS